MSNCCKNGSCSRGPCRSWFCAECAPLWFSLLCLPFVATMYFAGCYLPRTLGRLFK